MKRTTLKLPDDLDLWLRREAERRGTTISAITRGAIEGLRSGGRRRLAGGHAWDSGQRDVSDRIEALLREELVP